MSRHSESPATVGGARLPSPVISDATEPEPRNVPVAYEEVTLTEEAALIVENARREMAQRPKREVKRMRVSEASSPFTAAARQGIIHA